MTPKLATRLVGLAASGAVLVGAALVSGGNAYANTSSPAGLQVKPLVGQWQFGGGTNPADSITMKAPVGQCPTGSALYANLLTPQGEEATAATSGVVVGSVTAFGSDLTIPAPAPVTFADGGVQNFLRRILPADGTSDDSLAPADAGKTPGTVIADQTFSLIGTCLDANLNPLATYLRPIEITAATRPARPADWPADQYYDALQWSWNAKATSQAALTVIPKTIHENWPAIVYVTVKADDGSAVTGTVKITDGSRVLATAKVSKGRALSIVLPGLSVGAHQLTAVYSGSDTVNGTTSAPVTLTVTK